MHSPHGVEGRSCTVPQNMSVYIYGVISLTHRVGISVSTLKHTGCLSSRRRRLSPDGRRCRSVNPRAAFLLVSSRCGAVSSKLPTIATFTRVREGFAGWTRPCCKCLFWQLFAFWGVRCTYRLWCTRVPFNGKKLVLWVSRCAVCGRYRYSRSSRSLEIYEYSMYPIQTPYIEVRAQVVFGIFQRLFKKMSSDLQV